MNGELQMFVFRNAALAAVTALALMGSTPAWAGYVVNVSLWDKGADATMPKDLGYNFGGDMSKATMGIDATPKSIQAGHVTFEVINNSKDTIHEMVVAPLKSDDEVLPYNKAEERVEEEKAGHLGEVAELDPGQSGELGIDLDPGKYILYCNIPGHYAAGMWTILTVTK
jgi:uncharacterized cupredoxin-like copper-binding protein